MHNLDYKLVFVSICVVHLLTLCEGRPLSKRTVSEVQLMHNLGEHKQVQERRDWLQMRLRGIHTAPGRSGGGGGGAEGGRARRRLLRPEERPEELPELSELSPEEIQYALDFLEKLLKAKQT